MNLGSFTLSFVHWCRPVPSSWTLFTFRMGSYALHAFIMFDLVEVSTAVGLKSAWCAINSSGLEAQLHIEVVDVVVSYSGSTDDDGVSIFVLTPMMTGSRFSKKRKTDVVVGVNKKPVSVGGPLSSFVDDLPRGLRRVLR